MTVGKLRELLENYIDTLNQYEDDNEIHTVTNTYFLHGAKYFLGIAGYDGGYIDLSNLDEEIIVGDEDEERY